jgi:FtsP/CotA-like multicopper oxidase with cupredoxin domain
LIRVEEAATQEVQARGWDLNVVKGMIQDVDDSRCDLLQDADRVLQELSEEDKASWEIRARNQAAHVMHLAGGASKALDERRWSKQE